jgi:hypothetical protein
MANYRQIHTQIWRDNWFLDLEPDEKLLFIYLFSNDNSNLAGIYELHERIIQLETGLDRKRINEIITKLEGDGKVFYRDGVVWIVNMQKYHSNAGEKVRRNIELIIEDIPDCEVKEKYCIYNGIELEDTLSVPDDTLSEKKDTLSYSKSKSKLKSKSKTEEEEKSEKEEETPAGGTVTSAQSQKISSITDHFKKTGAQIKPTDEQAIQQLAAVFKTPDIHDAIDHMAAHTNRPNVGYLRKVLDGWFTERKIQKVYS